MQRCGSESSSPNLAFAFPHAIWGIIAQYRSLIPPAEKQQAAIFALDNAGVLVPDAMRPALSET